MCLVKGWGKGGAWRRHRHDPSLLSVNSSYSYLPNNQTHIFFYAWKQASCLMCPFNLHSHVQPGNVEMLLSSRQIQHNGKWRCIHNLKDFQFVFLQEEKKQLQRKKKKKSGWFGKCVKFPNFAGEQNWAFLWEPTSWKRHPRQMTEMNYVHLQDKTWFFYLKNWLILNMVCNSRTIHKKQKFNLVYYRISHTCFNFRLSHFRAAAVNKMNNLWPKLI